MTKIIIFVLKHVLALNTFQTKTNVLACPDKKSVKDEIVKLKLQKIFRKSKYFNNLKCALCKVKQYYNRGIM